jgi:hypothetical protein
MPFTIALLNLNNVFTMRDEAVDTLRFSEGVCRSLTVLWLNEINGPVTEIFATENDQIRIHSEFELSSLHAEISQAIGSIFKVDLDIECVGRVAPAQWTNRGPFETPTFHWFQWTSSSMKEPKIDAGSFGL